MSNNPTRVFETYLLGHRSDNVSMSLCYEQQNVQLKLTTPQRILEQTNTFITTGSLVVLINVCVRIHLFLL